MRRGHHWASRPSARTTSLGVGRSSSMLGGHAHTMETSAPFTPVDLPGQRAPWALRRRAGSAGPESPLLAGADSPVLAFVSLRRSTAGGALRVRYGVTSRPVNMCPAAADDVLGRHPPGCCCAAADKLAAARTAADRPSAKVYQVSSHGGTSTGSAGRTRATRRHVQARSRSRHGKTILSLLELANVNFCMISVVIVNSNNRTTVGLVNNNVEQ